MNGPDAAILLADLICAVHDNRGMPIRRRDADLLASDLVELLGVYGVELREITP